MSLWNVMQSEHDRIWDLLNRLTGGADEPHGTPAERHSLARELVAFAAGHEFVEEAVIWPEVRRRCSDGADLVQQAVEQESQGKWALNALRAIAADSEEFDQTVHSIAGQFRTHISYEQNQIWPRLADQLTEAEGDALLQRWQKVRQQAPSRPLPHMPADPRLLGLVGRVSAAVGRARESFLSR
jgi:hemerythrin-like domain-containing protein